MYSLYVSDYIDSYTLCFTYKSLGNLKKKIIHL